MAHDIEALKELPTVHVCAGPPRCVLEGREAEVQMLLGCTVCERIAIHPDGTETRYRLPAH